VLARSLELRACRRAQRRADQSGDPSRRFLNEDTRGDSARGLFARRESHERRREEHAAAGAEIEEEEEEEARLPPLPTPRVDKSLRAQLMNREKRPGYCPPAFCRRPG